MDVRRMPLGVILMAPVLVGLGVFAFTTQEPVTDPTAEATATAATEATATPPGGEWAYTPPAEFETAIAGRWATQTIEAIPPTATPDVTQRGAFRDGAWVRVNAGAGDCLNARNSPSLQSDYVIVQTCLPDGFEGYITGTSIEQDGHWWWYLAGTGWVAEDFLSYIRDVDLRQPQAPELAGHGRIAFLRGNDIWVMEADGSDQWLLADHGDDDPQTPDDVYVTGLRWSPNGVMLSYNAQHAGADGGAWVMDLRIIRLGNPVARQSFPNVMGGSWSPDNRHIGIIRDAQYDGMGGGANGLAGLLDIDTGLQTIFGGDAYYLSAPPEFNFDGTKLLMRGFAREGEPPYISITDTEGTPIGRIDQPANGFIAAPHWSPVDDRIAFHESDGTTPHYAIYDIASSQVIARAPVPAASDKIGGGCGGADMWRLDWNRTGTALLYSFSSGDTGANGIWTWDLAANTQRLTAAASAGPASGGPDSHYVFSAYGQDTSHILWAREGEAFPHLLTDGTRPVWHD